MFGGLAGWSRSRTAQHDDAGAVSATSCPSLLGLNHETLQHRLPNDPAVDPLGPALLTPQLLTSYRSGPKALVTAASVYTTELRHRAPAALAVPSVSRKHYADGECEQSSSHSSGSIKRARSDGDDRSVTCMAGVMAQSTLHSGRAMADTPRDKTRPHGWTPVSEEARNAQVESCVRGGMLQPMDATSPSGDASSSVVQESRSVGGGDATVIDERPQQGAMESAGVRGLDGCEMVLGDLGLDGLEELLAVNLEQGRELGLGGSLLNLSGAVLDGVDSQRGAGSGKKGPPAIGASEGLYGGMVGAGACEGEVFGLGMGLAGPGAGLGPGNVSSLFGVGSVPLPVDARMGVPAGSGMALVPPATSPIVLTSRLEATPTVNRSRGYGYGAGAGAEPLRGLGGRGFVLGVPGYLPMMESEAESPLPRPCGVLSSQQEGPGVADRGAVVPLDGGAVAPLPSYKQVYDKFRSRDVEVLLASDIRRGQVNVCFECCDRWADDPRRIALLWEGPDGTSSSQHTFAELHNQSARFASFLRSQGVAKGDRVASLLPRVPELLVVMLATWRLGAVFLPLFTAFGPKAVQYRLERADIKVLITSIENLEKVGPLLHRSPVVIVWPSCKLDSDTSHGLSPSVQLFDFHAEMARHEPDFAVVPLRAEEPFLLIFTSGTIGQPKGMYLPVMGILAILSYMQYACDLRPEDRFWNAADPAWAYGSYYGMIGPLLLGHSTIMYAGRFSVETTYHILSKYGVTNLCGAPTLYRQLMAGGKDILSRYNLRLRVAQSAGEPLNPEVIRWFDENLECCLYDQYGQTEVGMVVCNHHALEHTVRMGTMGRPVPGFRVVVLDKNSKELGPGEVGELAVDRTESVLNFFRGYMDQTMELAGKRQRYHQTGDQVEILEDGSFMFLGRKDDMIVTAGERISPFEVESTLLEHPSVAESAVIGKPDAECGEIVKAFVKLKDGLMGSAALSWELKRLVKFRLTGGPVPREIVFLSELPKTPSGKIQRYLLRQRERDQIDQYQE